MSTAINPKTSGRRINAVFSTAVHLPSLSRPQPLHYRPPNATNAMPPAFHHLPLIWAGNMNPQRTVPTSSSKPLSALPQLPRRLVLLSLLPLLLPAKAQARKSPKEPLSVSLQPLVRVRDALSELGESVDAGTNGDVRRLVRVLLAGSDLPRAARDAGLWLEPDRASKVEVATREAFEYLNQIIAYFDPVANRERPKSEMLAFCRQAIAAAAGQLDSALAFFEPSAVVAAREALAGPVL